MKPSTFETEQYVADCNFFVKLKDEFSKGHDHIKQGYLKASSVTPTFKTNAHGDQILANVRLEFEGPINPEKAGDPDSGALQVSPGPFLKNFLLGDEGKLSSPTEIVAINSNDEEELKITLMKDPVADKDKDKKTKVVAPLVQANVDGTHAHTIVVLSAPQIKVDGKQGDTPITYDVINFTKPQK